MLGFDEAWKNLKGDEAFDGFVFVILGGNNCCGLWGRWGGDGEEDGEVLMCKLLSCSSVHWFQF